MENVELTIFGERASKNYFKNYKLNNFGVITDDIRMSMIYSAADIFVAPSIEENLANTVLEALMSGIPVVAFNIGGMPDAIEHKINGYLAKPFDVDDLARGITWALENKNEFKKNFYDRFVKRFSQKHSMEKNIMLYNKLFKIYSDEKI
jgi:glycosyltransferase involved in cell wall biosynthesis